MGTSRVDFRPATRLLANAVTLRARARERGQVVAPLSLRIAHSLLPDTNGGACDAIISSAASVLETANRKRSDIKAVARNLNLYGYAAVQSREGDSRSHRFLSLQQIAIIILKILKLRLTPAERWLS